MVILLEIMIGISLWLTTVTIYTVSEAERLQVASTEPTGVAVDALHSALSEYIGAHWGRMEECADTSNVLTADGSQTRDYFISIFSYPSVLGAGRVDPAVGAPVWARCGAPVTWAGGVEYEALPTLTEAALLPRAFYTMRDQALDITILDQEGSVMGYGSLGMNFRVGFYFERQDTPDLVGRHVLHAYLVGVGGDGLHQRRSSIAWDRTRDVVNHIGTPSAGYWGISEEVTLHAAEAGVSGVGPQSGIGFLQGFRGSWQVGEYGQDGTLNPATSFQSNLACLWREVYNLSSFDGSQSVCNLSSPSISSDDVGMVVMNLSFSGPVSSGGGGADPDEVLYRTRQADTDRNTLSYNVDVNGWSFLRVGAIMGRNAVAMTGYDPDLQVPDLSDSSLNIVGAAVGAGRPVTVVGDFHVTGELTVGGGARILGDHIDIYSRHDLGFPSDPNSVSEGRSYADLLAIFDGTGTEADNTWEDALTGAWPSYRNTLPGTPASYDGRSIAGRIALVSDGEGDLSRSVLNMSTFGTDERTHTYFGVSNPGSTTYRDPGAGLVFDGSSISVYAEDEVRISGGVRYDIHDGSDGLGSDGFMSGTVAQYTASERHNEAVSFSAEGGIYTGRLDNYLSAPLEGYTYPNAADTGGVYISSPSSVVVETDGRTKDSVGFVVDTSSFSVTAGLTRRGNALDQRDRQWFPYYLDPGSSTSRYGIDDIKGKIFLDSYGQTWDDGGVYLRNFAPEATSATASLGQTFNFSGLGVWNTEAIEGGGVKPGTSTGHVQMVAGTSVGSSHGWNPGNEGADYSIGFGNLAHNSFDDSVTSFGIGVPYARLDTGWEEGRSPLLGRKRGSTELAREMLSYDGGIFGHAVGDFYLGTGANRNSLGAGDPSYRSGILGSDGGIQIQSSAGYNRGGSSSLYMNAMAQDSIGHVGNLPAIGGRINQSVGGYLRLGAVDQGDFGQGGELPEVWCRIWAEILSGILMIQEMHLTWREVSSMVTGLGDTHQPAIFRSQAFGRYVRYRIADRAGYY